jgi:signal recognition particle subunit SEC65|tara:strand:- start:583 stop:1248 length:666 start_codon:yes stop_codon:yes gene_type:complete
MTTDEMNLEYEINVQGKHQALKEASVNSHEQKIVDNTNRISLDSINQSDFNVYRDQLFLKDKSKKKSNYAKKKTATQHYNAEQITNYIISMLEYQTITDVIEDKEVRRDFKRPEMKWKSDKRLFKFFNSKAKNLVADIINEQGFIRNDTISGSGTTAFVIYNLINKHHVNIKSKKDQSVKMPTDNIELMNSLKFTKQKCVGSNHVDMFDKRLVKQKRRHNI